MDEYLHIIFMINNFYDFNQLIQFGSLAGNIQLLFYNAENMNENEVARFIFTEELVSAKLN
jgi:hypothetical protein